MAFIVTGLGRSGTMFLAKVLNTSKAFRVRHETKGDGDVGERLKLTLGELQGRLTGNVGEVNHYAALLINDVKVDKKAIIVRDVRNVILSYANKWRRRKGDGKKFKRFFVNKVPRQQPLLESLDKGLTSGIHKIEFSKMVSDRSYLEDIANYLEVTGVRWKKVDIDKKINFGTKEKAWPEYSDLPEWIRTATDELLWFNDKWLK
jgi:hypothetical protein